MQEKKIPMTTNLCKFPCNGDRFDKVVRSRPISSHGRVIYVWNRTYKK